MKKYLGILILISAGIALFEQSKAVPNVYIMAICIAIFMFGMMRLSAKLTSKNSDKENENDK